VTEINAETVAAAEIALVGAGLRDPKSLPDAGELPGSAFRDRYWGRAWDEMRRRYDAGEDIDPLVVADALGPPISPVMLSGAVIERSVPVSHAATIVREAWVSRQVIEAVEEIARAHKRDDARGSDLLSYALERIGRIRVDTKDAARPMSEILRARFADLAELAAKRARGEEALTGLPTGIGPLDDKLGGLQLGRITVIAARPGMGKSALVRQVADHCSKRGIGVHAFVLEDHWTAAADRTLAAHTKIPAQRIRRLEGFTRGDLAKVRDAAAAYSGRTNWLVDDRSGIGAEEIARSVRRLRPTNKTRLVIVDYVQLLQRQPGEGTREMIERSMKAFLTLARSDELSVVVLSQLNRKCESRDNKRPIPSDLKESGSLEEEAKSVLFLYRHHQYDKRHDRSDLEIIISKNNDGETGTTRAHWDGPTMTISARRETP
jgi:replicative DNA helicase